MESSIGQISMVTINVCVCMLLCDILARIINIHSKLVDISRLSSIKNRKVANKNLDSQYKRLYIDIAGNTKVLEDLMIILILVIIVILTILLYILNNRFRIISILLDSLLFYFYIKSYKNTDRYIFSEEEKIKLSIIRIRVKFNSSVELTDNDKKLLEKDFKDIEKAFKLDKKKNNFKLTQNRINNLSGKLESFIYNKA